MEWKTVFLVEEATTELIKEIKSDPDIFRFKMLPLIALKAGHPWESSTALGLQKVDFTETSFDVAWAINRALLEASHLARTWAINGNRWVLKSKYVAPFSPLYLETWDSHTNKIIAIPKVQWIRIAHPTAIALSLQMQPRNKMTDHHILGIATKVAAKYLPVIVAAGNYGAHGSGILSPMARLPWTIAVGASSDTKGSKLHEISSIGKKNSKLGEGITIVAYGENHFHPGEFGTSFAVPRALQCLMLLTSFILQLRTEEELKRKGVGGTPLLFNISVDVGFDGFDPTPKMPLQMIPRVGVNKEDFHFVLDTLQEAGLVLHIAPKPAIMKQMLISSARPMIEYKAHEVGYGFVSRELTIDYLSEFTGLDLAKLFFDESVLNPSLCKTLSSYKLANKDELEILEDITVKSVLWHSIDYKSGEIHASMRDPGMDPDETEFRKEKSNYSWPISI